MSTWVSTIWAEYNTFAKDAPIVASMVSLAAIASLTYTFKTLPIQVLSFLRRQCGTTLELDNAGDGVADSVFLNMMEWFDQHPLSRLSRTMRVYSAWSMDKLGVYSNRLSIGLGGGLQIATWEGRLVFINRTRLADGGSNTNKILYQISITRLGRDRDSLYRLVNYFKPTVDQSEISIFHYGDGGWEQSAPLHPRSLTSIVATDGVIESITNSIDDFLASEEWYLQRGIPYKLCILLKGTPGCGKSSLIRALAHHYKRSVNAINMAEMTDRTLKRAFNTSSSDRFIALEDFNVESLRARTANLSIDGKLEAAVVNNQPTRDAASTLSFLTLHGVLQVFDGLESIHGKIIFLTTNVYEELDVALVRKGRVDKTVELSPLGNLEIRKYLRLVSPETHVPDSIVFDALSGADLQALYIDNSTNIDAFINAIPRVKHHQQLRSV